jgi:glycosyltransferase involved in cell wall biosynthesis
MAIMDGKKIKLVRITTVSLSLKYLLPGQMSYMREHGFDVTMMSADGPEVKEVIEKEKCAFHPLPLQRTITPLKDLACIWYLFRWLKKQKPAIIHSETPKAGLVAMISGWMAGVPVRIHTVAGLPLMVEKGFKYQLLAAVERITNAAATTVWPNSFSLQKIMLERKLCSPAKMSVLAFGSSNGTNIERYNPSSIEKGKLQQVKQLFNYDAGLFYNICVARLVRDKGISELAAAFSKIYESDKHQRLLLIGPYEEDLDPLPAETHEIIKNHPGIARIPITDSVEYFLYLSHLFIFPSYREGFPNVLMEAGSIGIPIICSRIEGNVDLVENKKTGLLFEKMNANDLFEKWQYAIKHPLEMKAMAETLQQMVHSRFDRTIIWQAMHHAYLSQLKQ